jgi:hypothetical protein
MMWHWGSPDDVVSSQACDSEHDPETLFDNLLGNEDISVGDTFDYCLTAYNRASVIWAEDEGRSTSYESRPTCVKHTVLWVR